MNQEKIGKFIAECRKKQKLTQEQLAEKLGVTDRAVSNWENGKNMPDLSMFKLLCDELNISINELMSGEELDESRYIKKLEENIITMVNNIETKKKRKFKWALIILLIVTIFGWLFYNFHLIDIKYDSRVSGCNIENDILNIYVKGQSVWNTKFVIKEVDNEDVYLVHSTLNVYNKRRSNWDYSQSIAKLLAGEEIIYGSFHNIELVEDSILELEDSMMNSISDINMSDINQIRELTRTIVKNTRPLLHIGNRIMNGNMRYLNCSDIKKHNLENLQGVDFGFDKLYGFAMSTRELADKLLDIYSSQVTEKTNSLITKLTVLTAITSPLTIITGIYGMNFKNMPELNFYYGYYLILIIMVTIIFISLFIMKIKKLL